MLLLTDRYAQQICGTLSCYDRMVITGTLPGICYPEGMAAYVRSKDIRIFDYPQFASPLRDEIRENAERLAKEQGVEVEYVRSPRSFRKEDRIRAILAARGDHPGLVHILSTIEPCTAFIPWYDKATGTTSLRRKEAKCVHYYFYFIDPEFGLCYLRVPTWAPFRLQFYCNGHNWLARQLTQAGITYTQLDNAFANISDIAKAQTIADRFPVERLHQTLDILAVRCCPVLTQFGATYHWSLMQLEYATDIIFRRQDELRPLYDVLVRTAIHTVKPDHIATFLGRKLTGNYAADLGNDFHTRVEGTCIKHHMGPVAIKLYDKYGLVLRIETTVNDVSFFRHYRTVEHRDGTRENKVASAQKTIYSLGAVRELLVAANRRYLEFLSQLVDPTAGLKKAEQISQTVREQERTYRGFNLFDTKDLDLFVALARGEWQISGFQNRILRQVLPNQTGPQMSRLLRRLHVHGLIKKVGRTYKYYLTRLGQDVLLTALKLRQLVLIPSLAGVIPA